MRPHYPSYTHCNLCIGETQLCTFEFRHLEVDHIIPPSRCGGDHIENLQVQCAHCNRVKGDRTQEYLMAQLRELGIAACKGISLTDRPLGEKG